MIRAGLVTMDEKSQLFPGRKRRETTNRSGCATCCHSCSAITYLPILLFAALYLGLFVRLDIQVEANDYQPYSGSCILFGQLAQTEDEFVLDQNFSCELSIYGSIILIFFIFMLLAMAIFDSIWGRWIMCTKLFELNLLGVCVCISLLISIVLSLGYSITCSAQKLYEPEDKNKRCMDLKLPITELDYGYHMLIIEIVSWLVTAMLIIAFLFQLMISLSLCCKKKQHKSYTRYNERNLKRN